MTDYDVIVVGAGSAGCVLAARLSEDPSRSVLLVEAGKHYGALADYPPELANASSLEAVMPGHPDNWSFLATLMPGRNYPLARGKVVGGSSALNGTVFMRGRREDFDEWAAMGNTEWSYDKVLPYYIRTESDLDFSGPDHGKDGPVPIRRPAPEELRPVSKAFVEACLRLGYPQEPDKNGGQPEGIGPMPRNSIDGMRLNTGVTHLAEALKRPNLTLVDECMVHRVLFDGTRATGIEASTRGERIVYSGSEIVLCAGGIKSPHLLLVSGVGPAAELEAHGVPVVADSPAVGKNVADHPTLFLIFKVGAEAEDRANTSPPIQVSLNYSSTGPDERGDLQINCVSTSFSQMMKASPKSDGSRRRLPGYLIHPIRTLRGIAGLSPRLVVEQIATQHDLQVLCSLEQESSTGTITLRSADPTAPPQIDLNFLSHPDDLPRLRSCVRQGLDIIAGPELSALGSRIVAPGEGERGTDDELDAWIRANMRTAYHSSCGARMGPDSDANSVVDQYCRVKGVTGLRVVDLSILPRIVRRAPAGTAVLLGERAASFFDTRGDKG